jgi:hypothetical protein
VDDFYQTLGISAEQRELQEFTRQIELTKDPQSLRIYADKISRQIKNLENEKRLLETNIAFFAHAKNAQQFTGDTRAKIDKYGQDIALLKEKLALLKARKG